MQRKRGVVFKSIRISINKRQQFIIGILVLALGFFFAENFFSHAGFLIAFVLAILSDVFLYWGLRKDLQDNNSAQIFILPFLLSLSFGLFYYLVPARYLARIVMTILYGIGLYSLFLSQNIFSVSSIRTIALLASARTVSFVISLISYFFLIDVLFSLHLPVFFGILIFFIFTCPMVLQSLWTYTLQKKIFADISWTIIVTICIMEMFVILWFWPSSPTVLALFITGLFYTLVGLSHAWLEKRLFKSVIWEYIWVAIIVFAGLFLFTSWT